MSSHLMKASAKRRRSKAQIKEGKLAESQNKADIDAKLAQIQEMQAQMEAM